MMNGRCLNDILIQFITFRLYGIFYSKVYKALGIQDGICRIRLAQRSTEKESSSIGDWTQELRPNLRLKVL